MADRVVVFIDYQNTFEGEVVSTLGTGVRCEVAAWRPAGQHARRLSIKGRNLWCHWMDEHVYQAAHDPTDYVT